MVVTDITTLHKLWIALLTLKKLAQMSPTQEKYGTASPKTGKAGIVANIMENQFKPQVDLY